MTTPNLNQLAPISDFDNAYVLAQQAHEQGFRGSTFADLYLWLKTKLDVLGLSNTAGLPEEFPQDGAILTAANAGEWTILGPGIYHQPGYPSIEVAEGTVVFAQFDGTQYSIQREVEMPVKQLTDSEYMLLEQYVQNGNPVFNEDGVLSSVSVLWTDEEPGVLNFLDYNFTFMSYDSYTVTYKTKTLTQPKVTRDNEGNIIVKPLKTVS